MGLQVVVELQNARILVHESIACHGNLLGIEKAIVAAKALHEMLYVRLRAMLFKLVYRSRHRWAVGAQACRYERGQHSGGRGVQDQGIGPVTALRAYVLLAH